MLLLQKYFMQGFAPARRVPFDWAQDKPFVSVKMAKTIFVQKVRQQGRRQREGPDVQTLKTHCEAQLPSIPREGQFPGKFSTSMNNRNNKDLVGLD